MDEKTTEEKAQPGVQPEAAKEVAKCQTCDGTGHAGATPAGNPLNCNDCGGTGKGQ